MAGNRLSSSDRHSPIDEIRNYYGRVLKTNKDLQTSACCTAESLPSHLRPLVANVHPEILERFYGCGSPIPPELSGRTVLDLGCGTGRDCYVLSQLVGPSGRVLGVDMTDEQLELARKHQDYHAKKFAHRGSNVEFRKGYIEDLEAAGIESGSVDVVVSNCVINLSPDKSRVFNEIFRVLKPGGELYFSDVFASRRIPKESAADPLLLGECLGGALYIEDFRRLLQSVGCADYRTVSRAKLTLNHPEIEAKVGMIDFYSITVRAFKLALEDRCEDYGQVAYYLGSVPEYPHAFGLDDHHLLATGRPMLVCSNTAAMLGATRYAKHFKIIGDTSVHYGLFDCARSPATTPENAASGACC